MSGDHFDQNTVTNPKSYKTYNSYSILDRFYNYCTLKIKVLETEETVNRRRKHPKKTRFH